MEKDNLLKLSGLSTSLKILITGFVLTLSLGYLVALMQIFDRTHYDMARTVLYYRGEETGAPSSILLPQSFTTLLSVAHVHTFSQPVMLGLLGLFFVFSHLSEKAKSFLLVLSFSGSVVSNAAPWCIRYLSGSLVFLLPVSQAALMISFFVMGWVILYDLWWIKESGS